MRHLIFILALGLAVAGCRESKRYNTTVVTETHKPEVVYLDKVRDKRWVDVEINRAISNYELAGGEYPRPLTIYITTNELKQPRISATAILVQTERNAVPDLGLALSLWSELS